ncbi:MAG: HAD-IC family P-type ATPase [Oscillospiraceae bacterium]|nr:HAD-IC family P-type ATPase [Oscillospiraceae bacterium]MBQ6465871.1 HAD-IC family P-type ATPase [Oscillospiraceae bacterium]
MGKHEAPKNSAKHARPAEKNRASAPLRMPDLSGIASRLTGWIRRPARAAEKHERREYEFNMQNVATVAVGALLFAVASLLPTKGWVRLLVFFVPYLLLGLDTLRDALVEALDREFFGSDLLIAAATIACFGIGQWQSAVFVMLIYRVVVMACAYATGERSRMADELCIPLPDTAKVETGAGLTESELSAVAVGSIAVVEPGEIIPLDGIVVDGVSSVELSPLTGGDTIRNVATGSAVYAGSVNRTNELRIRTTAENYASLAEKASRIAGQAAESQTRSGQPLRYAARLIPVLFTVAALVVGVLVPVLGGNWSTWLYRGVLLLCVAGSAPLLLALSLASHTAVCRAAGLGAYLRSVDALDSLSRAETMIFTKTGTVTEGHYVVEAVYPEKYSEKDLLTIAALAECQSLHPIAQALREACGIGIHRREDIHLVEEVPGRGVSTLFSGRSVYVGNAALLLEHDVQFSVPSRSGTVVHVAVDGEYAGHIVLNDKVREGAFDAVEELRIRGVRSTVMLTGDMRSVARPIASSLNFDLVKCELSPDAKISALEYLQASKGSQAAIACVSCKDRDEELLKRADVGILFAALDQNRALEAADISILDNSIHRLPKLYAIAKSMSLRFREDLIAYFAVKALLLLLGILGVLSIWAAVLLDLLAAVAVLFNAFRK